MAHIIFKYKNRISEFISMTEGEKISGPRLAPPINSATSRTSISRRSSNLCSFYSTILFDSSRWARSCSAIDQSTPTRIPSIFLRYSSTYSSSRSYVPAEAGLLWSITTASSSLIAPSEMIQGETTASPSNDYIFSVPLNRKNNTDLAC